MADDCVRVPLKVIPSASRDELAGWLGDTLRVRVAAPPERGKANAAAERLLAASLGAGRDRVRIVAGATSQRKVVEITGLSAAEIRRRTSREES